MRIHTLCGIVALLLLSNSVPIPYSTTNAQSTPLSITATTSIVADLVQNIGDDLVDVSTLINTGVDPHDFEPTISDIQLINSSDHIFWSGSEETLFELLEFWEEEGSATNLLESIDPTLLIEGEDHEDEDEHGLYDPHFWMSPILMKEAAIVINNTLSALNPEHTNSYHQNTLDYLDELDNLHTYIQSEVDKLPQDDKFLVTQHNSLAYYAREYDFTTATLQGISTETQAGVREIDALANYIVENDIKVVFAENAASKNDLEAVLDAARAQGHGVVIAGTLYVASLGDNSNTNTYLKMMTYNTDLIVTNILNPPEDTNSFLDNSLLGIFGLLGISMIVLVTRVRRHS